MTLQINDFVTVFCGRGYRPGIVKEIGKRTVLIEWADDTSERVNHGRVIEARDLKELSFIERMFYMEEDMIKNHKE
jgi:hypothetical protein